MEKKPEVDGKWVDIEADELMSRMEDVENCDLLAIRSLRIELGSEDRDAFVAKLNKVTEESETEMSGMSDDQKSFYLFRKMLVR